MKNRQKDILIILSVLLIYYLQHLFTVRLGLNYEEFRDANAYLMMLEGKVPYRDFEWLYGPLALFIYPLAFKFFGVHLLVLRIVYIFFGSLVIPLSYFLSKRILPASWSGVAAFLTVVFFDVPYYTFNHVFAILGEIVSLLMVCKYLQTQQFKFYFFSGLAAGLVVLTKPLLYGLSLFMGVFLFILIAEGLRQFAQKLKSFILFIVGVLVVCFPYFIYFYFQTAGKNLPVKYPLFGEMSSNYLNSLRLGNIQTMISHYITNLSGIFSVFKIFTISSFSALKILLVEMLDSLVFYLPFYSFLFILLIFFILRNKKDSHILKISFFAQEKFLLLLVVFSLCISFESVMSPHRLLRSWITQVPFILFVYSLYFIIHYPGPRFVILRRIGVFLGILFLLSISALHFLRYPYSMFREYTAPLNLERARGIQVAPEEKEFYESLNAYLQENLKGSQTMLVYGYYPQLSFLTKQKNLFADNEHLFETMELLEVLKQRGNAVAFPILQEMEEKVISKIERHKPKIALLVRIPGVSFGTPRVKDYIERKYSPEKTFGPVRIFGIPTQEAKVEIYKLRNFSKGAKL